MFRETGGGGRMIRLKIDMLTLLGVAVHHGSLSNYTPYA